MRAAKVFTTVETHTEGMPTRVVTAGFGAIPGDTMLARSLHVGSTLDGWRRLLMYEPRGHQAMSGAILTPPTRPDADLGVVYIEVTGCLPMCGHGTIGTVTIAVENGLIRPRVDGQLSLDTPAGRVDVRYRQEGRFVEEVRLTNVPSFLHSEGLAVTLEGLGEIVVDVAYGGNFYAIVEAQANFADMADFSVSELVGMSQRLRAVLNAVHDFAHPDNPEIAGLSHILWTGAPRHPEADARNAVFYGDKAIDRSPCGTGTSARMAQLAAKGRLAPGDAFVHESIIGTLFHGRVEAGTELAGRPAIIPSIAGWARVTGLNTIYIDDRDPLAHGFVVT